MFGNDITKRMPRITQNTIINANVNLLSKSSVKPHHSGPKMAPRPAIVIKIPCPNPCSEESTSLENKELMHTKKNGMPLENIPAASRNSHNGSLELSERLTKKKWHQHQRKNVQSKLILDPEVI